MRMMRESGAFRTLMQYGYDTDVLDKYRDAVARYNRGALSVLSAAGILTAAVTLAVSAVNHHTSGLILCLVMLAVSAAAIAAARQKTSGLRTLRAASYILCLAFYALAIYGNVMLDLDAFWVGVNMAVGCYMLDYSLRMFALQGVSFLALVVVMDGVTHTLTVERFAVNAVFLLAGMVTVYVLGRSRLGLIMSREATKVQADTDRLTGLMNRNAAQEDIEADLAEGEGSGVLMLLDLDRFKSVNDRLGHQMGDRVLTEVAADLKKMFRNTDILSRLGGDEFIIYMKSVPEKDWARQRAEQVVQTVRRWVGDGTTNIQVTASVGIVMTDGMERVYQNLYRAADIAMYFSKAQGGNNAVFYSKDLLNEARNNLVITHEDGEAKTLAEHNGAKEALR